MALQYVNILGATLVVLTILVTGIPAQNDCPAGSIAVATSIPIDLPTPSYVQISTYKAWLDAIQTATSTIDIACYYMTLTDGASAPSSQGGYQGLNVFRAIQDAALSRGVKVRIVQQLPDARMPAYDTGNLTAMGAAEVRSIDFAAVNGYNGMGGILHTKLMVVDGTNAYIGSANMDWRSLTQVKEVGIMVNGCPTYANDVEKIFEQYWMAAAATSLPVWPSSIFTPYTRSTPMIIGAQNTPMIVASGPGTFAAEGREDELVAIVAAIASAKKFVKFSVMDYTPTSMYTKQPFYWPPIDDALRSAALNGVQVQLMFSVWNHTNSRQLPYWRSLNDIYNVRVQTYKIPDAPVGPPAPFSRVSHSKYIVTDQSAYVTTSNCGADYYLYTGGVSANLLDTQSSAYNTLDSMFNADWSSSFAGPIPDRLPPRTPFAPSS